MRHPYAASHSASGVGVVATAPGHRAWCAEPADELGGTNRCGPGLPDRRSEVVSHPLADSAPASTKDVRLASAKAADCRTRWAG
jgi:hypothetical protein